MRKDSQKQDKETKSIQQKYVKNLYEKHSQTIKERTERRNAGVKRKKKKVTNWMKETGSTRTTEKEN